ncbi:multicopper oxidase family protein [Streptomyces sp. NPDC057743]|uniref:multicopper oxidase family protein n=1 Tax=Streptomyces sp. NPDC057743 TaxID=3346236 RepID=UPI0036B60F27
MDSLRTHSRRALLGAGIAVAGGGLLAASAPGVADSATGPNGRPDDGRSGRGGYVDPHGPEVADAEDRRTSGPVRRLHVEARETRVDLGGRTVHTWAYGDGVPGEELRLTAGETLAVTLLNRLPQSTTLHWHGLPLRNDMDGVPDVTQRPVKPGASFHYRFKVTDPGTYWMHPHLGVQQDHGLYAPLIVDDPKEPMAYDKEWVVVLDDWLDGVDGSDPDTVLNELNHGRGLMHGDADDMHGHGRDAGHKHRRKHGHRRDDDRRDDHDRDDRDDQGAERGHEGRDGGRADEGGLSTNIGGPDVDPDVDPDDMDLGRLGLDAGAERLFTERATRGARRGDGPRDGGRGPSRILHGAHSRLLRSMPGNVDYPYHLINGRTHHDPETFRARPGDRIRIRFINAGGDTAYRVALGGHHMTVTHTDGNPVEHARTDALLIGMAERYDVVVTVRSGVFPLVALAEGKRRSALAVLRTAEGRAPEASARPKALDGRLMTADRLRAHESVRARSRRPDRIISLKLTGNMRSFDWAINGRPYTPSQRYGVREGERVRLVFRNRTSMFHPMHLHGHSFHLPNGGPRKDTTLVYPGERLAVDFDADNPGLWMLHCHNIYHSESGMMTVLGYRRK